MDTHEAKLDEIIKASVANDVTGGASSQLEDAAAAYRSGRVQRLKMSPQCTGAVAFSA